MKGKSVSAKLSLIAVAVNLITLIAFVIYGTIYSYMDSMVVLSLLLSTVCGGVYALVDRKATEFLNLVQVLLVSYGVGLFFLNSYPVWADRLNNITMYGARGSLVPVVAIILLCFATAILGIASCFTRKEAA
ncbi:hypothetical protein [Pseudoflavonifractor capillosus]|uniref:Uncharacterized protein n=1 Tax=Pseudoflavonifractor capillosus TaxID=106588 RepID=A0A921MNJ9_9FIRM|nr:hypothetical protein [Pseudoflavonifractor capillosus]HJG87421.1 hypothetical protein [Pseudoflavonifractor capillosus]